MLPAVALGTAPGGQQAEPVAVFGDDDVRLIAIAFVWDAVAGAEVAQVASERRSVGAQRPDVPVGQRLAVDLHVVQSTPEVAPTVLPPENLGLQLEVGRQPREVCRVDHFAVDIEPHVVGRSIGGNGDVVPHAVPQPRAAQAGAPRLAQMEVEVDGAVAHRQVEDPFFPGVAGDKPLPVVRPLYLPRLHPEGKRDGAECAEVANLSEVVFTVKPEAPADCTFRRRSAHNPRGAARGCVERPVVGDSVKRPVGDQPGLYGSSHRKPNGEDAQHGEAKAVLGTHQAQLLATWSSPVSPGGVCFVGN